MSNTPIFRIEGRELVEQPTMKEPVLETSLTDDLGNEHKREEHAAYYKHLASLRRYPHNLPDSLQGVDLIEGEHFRLQHQWMTGLLNKENREEWEYLDIDEEEYNELGHACRRIIALPISQPEQPISEEGKVILPKFMVVKNSNDYLEIWTRREYERYIEGCVEVGAALSHKIVVGFNGDEDFLFRKSTPSPSQEAIEFAEWIKAEQWDPAPKEMKQWYRKLEGQKMEKKTTKELYTEHKNSKQ